MAKERGIFKPTLIITFFSLLGILVNFLTQVVLAAKFGAQREMDSYLAASVIPQFITTVLLGALNLTFVPLFIEYETRKDKKTAWKVASIFTNWTALSLAFIALAGCIFSSQLLSITAPGFKGESFLLTDRMLRILLPTVIFGGLNSLLSSLYYSQHKFFKPALAGLLNSGIMFLFVVLFEPALGIASVAWGTLCGSIINAIFLFGIFFREERYQFSWDITDTGVVKIFRLMAPLVAANLFYRANTIIERMLASNLPEGSISYLGYSTTIVSILDSLTTGGISLTIFTLMSHSWAEDDLNAVRNYFAKGVRAIMMVSFPLAAVIAVLRVPIIGLVLERGVFTSETTQRVANVLLIHLGVLICGGLGTVIGKSFYVSQRTGLCAVLGILQAAVYIAASIVLSHYFSYLGLAAATTVYRFVGVSVSTIATWYIYKGLNGMKIWRGFWRIMGAVLISSAVMYLVKNLILPSAVLFNTLLALAAGAVSYTVLIIYVFRLEEAIELKERLRAKFRESLPLVWLLRQDTI